MFIIGAGRARNFEAQMRSIVADAVAQSQPAPQPQPSGDEIMAMVNAAMAAMPQQEGHSPPMT